jgi:hypothetical protein
MKRSLNAFAYKLTDCHASLAMTAIYMFLNLNIVTSFAMRAIYTH